MRDRKKTGTLAIGAVLALTTVAVIQTTVLVGEWSSRSELGLEGYRTYEPGEPLGEVTIRTEAGNLVALRELVQDVCRVFVAFDPDCPYCRDLAEEGVVGERVLGVPVHWLALPTSHDDAEQFIEDYDIRGPWFMIESWKDVGETGIVATPTLVAIGPDNVYRGRVYANNPQLPPGCDAMASASGDPGDG